jgi:hypothetical protein
LLVPRGIWSRTPITQGSMLARSVATS